MSEDNMSTILAKMLKDNQYFRDRLRSQSQPQPQAQPQPQPRARSGSWYLYVDGKAKQMIDQLETFHRLKRFEKTPYSEISDFYDSLKGLIEEKTLTDQHLKDIKRCLSKLNGIPKEFTIEEALDAWLKDIQRETAARVYAEMNVFTDSDAYLFTVIPAAQLVNIVIGAERTADDAESLGDIINRDRFNNFLKRARFILWSQIKMANLKVPLLHLLKDHEFNHSKATDRRWLSMMSFGCHKWIDRRSRFAHRGGHVQPVQNEVFLAQSSSLPGNTDHGDDTRAPGSPESAELTETLSSLWGQMRMVAKRLKLDIIVEPDGQCYRHPISKHTNRECHRQIAELTAIDSNLGKSFSGL